MFLDQSTSLFRGLSRSLDYYLLEFFGSKENAERYGHLYILEQHPYAFDTQLEGDDNLMKITAHTTYRLRLKTREEKLAEQESRDKNTAYNES